MKLCRERLLPVRFERWWIPGFILLFVMPAVAWATFPGREMESEVMRLLERGPRGKVGDLTTSQGVLFWYEDLNPVFDAALREVRQAREDADRYRVRMPSSNSEWGHYLDALQRMQLARERYQEALRGTIAERRPTIEKLLNQGTIKARKGDLLAFQAQQTRELAALEEVHQQILQQESLIRNGQMPNLTRPQGLNVDWWNELVEAVRVSVQDGNRSLPQWDNLNRRVVQLKANLQAAAKELRAAAKENWQNMDDLERKAYAELSVLAEAQIDLASNAMLQQTTIRRMLMVQKTYEVWQELDY